MNPSTFTSTSVLDDKQLSITFSKASTFIKLGFLSVNRQNIPRACTLFCFVISHFQTIAVLLNNARLYLPKQNDIGSSVIKAYLKIFGFADFFSYTNSTSVSIWAIIMLIYCLHFVVLLLYMSIKLKKQAVIPDYIQSYWSVMTCFHPLVFFYPIHTFNIRVLQGVKLETFADPLSIGAMIPFYANIVINFLLSFLITRLCYVVIKTKDPLSCKNTFISTNDIMTKTITPILWIFAGDSEVLEVFVIIATVGDCIKNDIVLFYYLPYYTISTLGIATMMQAITTTLAITTFIARVVSSSKMDLGQYFVHTSWILLAPIFMRLYKAVLGKVLTYIIYSKHSDLRLHYAIHKRYLLSYLIRKRIPPTSDTRVFNFPYFLFQGMLANKGIDVEKLSLQDPAEIKAMSLRAAKTYYLELVCRYPKSHVAKLTLANFYVKKENSYLLANNLIEEVCNDSPSFSVRVSLSLIRFELQKKTYKQYSQNGEQQSLDLLFYVQITNLNNQLKQQIKHQIRKQVEFWENFVSSKPDMGTLTELALKVDEEKQDILKTWKQMAKIRPSTFYIPPLVYGMYASMVNNNIMEGEKWIDRYQNDILNCSKQLEVDDLNNDTIMAEDTVRITMSGSRTKIGYILDVSTNINQVYGWKKEFLIKQPIVAIMTPYYQHKHDGFLVNHYNTGKTKLLNNTSLLPVVGCDGYIRPSRVHIKMHPFVEQGISYVAVMRTLREPRRLILVRKDGSIDGMSKNFATDMNLLSIDKSNHQKAFEIFSFCPGFRAVNSAFNKKAIAVINENLKADLKNVSSPRKHSPVASEDMSPVTEHDDEDFDSHFSWKRFGHKRDKSPKSISEKSPKEAETRVQAIYDMFTTGSQLIFHPRTTHIVNGNKIKLFAGNKPQEAQFKPIAYNVQIITRVHGKEFIKVVYLDRILEEGEEAAAGGKSLFANNTPQNFMSPLMNPTEHLKQLQNPAITSGRLTSSRPLMSPQSFGQKNEQVLLKVNVQNTESDEGSAKMTIPEEGADDLEFDHAVGKTVRKRYSNNKPQDIEEGEEEESTIFEPQSAKLKEAPSDRSLSNSQQGAPSRKSKFSKIVEQARHIIHFDHQLRSFEETEPVQEDNLLRKKLQKIRQKLDREPIHHQNLDRGNEGSVSGSTASSKAKKVQDSIKKALDVTIYTKSAIAFCICFLLFVVLVLIFQTFECTGMVSLVNDITSKTDVLGNGLFRINSFLNVGMYARAWHEYLGYGSLPDDDDMIGSIALYLMFWIYSTEAQSFDNIVREQISHIDAKYQRDFYTKSVTMYDPTSENTKVDIGDYTNFDASGLILDHAFRFTSEQADLNFNSTNTEHVDFVLVNIFNDFLVSSETATSLLITDVDDTLDKTIDKVTILYGFTVGAIVAFLLVALIYLYNINRDSNRFTELFFRFDVHEAQEIKTMLGQFIHSIEVNIHDIEDIHEKYDTREKVKNDKNASRKINLRKPIMDGLFKKQVLSFARLLPAFAVIIIWTVNYFISTKSSLSDISMQQQQIRYSLQMLYQQNLVIVEFTEFITSNGTSTVRNLNVEDALLDQLEALKDVGSFIDKFRDSNGELSIEEQEVFYSFPCSQFGKYSGSLKSYMINSCYDLSYGAKDTSFTTINTLLYSSIKEYYQQFVDSDRSTTTIEELFSDTSGSFNSLALVAPNMCSILYYTTLTDFNSKTQDAKDQAIGFAVITIVGILLISVIAWFCVIRKILKLEAHSKMILRLIPVHSILANQYLKQYLIQNSNHILDNIKRFL